MSPALLSTLVLLAALALFVSERVRHDLVALFALFATMLLGLVSPAQAFEGFADPAVLTVAAVLVVGRAVELSGAASGIARWLIPARASFTVRLSLLLIVAALLSAFMNNIAALVITMPIATDIARRSRLPPGATLMPLAFATILGGMTTLIGTPANLILSSVREAELGAPLGFFEMTPVGVAVTVVGLGYLAVLGWRMLPRRRSSERETRPPWRMFELTVPPGATPRPLAALLPRFRNAGARMLALFREGERILGDTIVEAGDRLLFASREPRARIAALTGLTSEAETGDPPGAVTSRVAVGHGSMLIGAGHEEIPIASNHTLRVVAVGPRAVRKRVPLASVRIRAGDQLYLRGTPAEIAAFLPRARLLEIDRLDRPEVAKSRAALTIGIFAIAIATVVSGLAPPAIAFLGAATLIAALRLIPADEIYRSVDWSVVVLLAAMIPVGRSFESSGAATIAGHWLAAALQGQPLFLVLAALCALTLVLSVFLNNIATAVIMGPLAIDAVRILGISPDAGLLAVLIGTSSDFLTPIGHQNNLLVMGPGGYRFTDYIRMGAIMVVLVVGTAAAVLTVKYG